MNKIEKKNIVPELGDELAELKKEVLKQAPQVAKHEASPMRKEIQKSMAQEDMAQKENADKKLEQQLQESESKIEGIASAERSEYEREKGVAKKTKRTDLGRQLLAKSDLHLPSDASVASNTNRIKDANAPLNQMLAAGGISGWIFKKIFGFSESDRIPENLA